MGIVEKEKCNFSFKPRILDHKIFETLLLFFIRGISFPFVKGKQNICFYVREQHYWQYFNCQVHSFMLTSITDISKGHTIYFWSIKKLEVILNIWHNFS